MRRVRRSRFLVGLGLLALIATLLPSNSSLAATPDTPYEVTRVEAPEVQQEGWFGDGMTHAGDLNDDGVEDFFVGHTLLDIGGADDVGRVYAMSGLDRSVLYVIDSPDPQPGSQFGFFFSAFGDVDGDEKLDIAIGTYDYDIYTGSGAPCGDPEPNGCNEGQGKAWVFSGADGSLLYELDNPAPQGSEDNRTHFGSRIGAAGDVTGDGIGDVLVAAPYNDQPAGCGDVVPLPAGCRVDEGEAFIFGGDTGELVRTLNMPLEDRQPAGICTGNCGWFGVAVQTPGDTNGDDVADQLVSAPSYSSYTGEGPPCGAPEPNGCRELQGRMYLFSGQTGDLLHRIDIPFPDDRVLFGFQDVTPQSPGDVNGDGLADLYGGASEEGEFEGQGFIFDGATGDLLYALQVPDVEQGDFLWSLDSTDYNGDGTPDLYVGLLAVFTLPQDENGGTFIYDGRDGTLLKTLELPEADREPGRRVTDPPNAGPFLGWSVLAFDDLNGDGQPDYVGSTPRKDEGEVLNVGRLYFFLSRSLLVQACSEVTDTGFFVDIGENLHADAIRCIASFGVTEGGPSGLPANQYGPDLQVRRDQMASFIARMIDVVDPDALPPAGANAFPCGSDAEQALTTANVHYDNIQRLAAADVVLGGPDALPDDCYGPDLTVTRAQMASFINRAIGVLTGTPLSTESDFFTDDEASVHEPNINALAAEEIVLGRSDTAYDPSSSVRRDQMASFIGRTMGFLVQSGTFTPPVA